MTIHGIGSVKLRLGLDRTGNHTHAFASLAPGGATFPAYLDADGLRQLARDAMYLADAVEQAERKRATVSAVSAVALPAVVVDVEPEQSEVAG